MVFSLSLFDFLSKSLIMPTKGRIYIVESWKESRNHLPNLNVYNELVLRGLERGYV